MTKTDRNCATCGAAFQLTTGPGSGRGSAVQKYCSMACKPAGTRTVPPGGIEKLKVCKWCSEEFLYTRVGRGREKQYCSESCRKSSMLAAQRERITGEGNPKCDIPVCTVGAQSLKGGLCYEHYQFQHRAKKFGLTPQELHDLREVQRGACAICGDTPRSLHIDHDHDTGAVRGLLCGNCNTGIGMLKDSTEVLSNAIAYLTASRADVPREDVTSSA